MAHRESVVFAAVAFLGALIGSAHCLLAGETDSKLAVESAARSPVAVDFLGDPLPAGAVARLGSTRFQAAHESPSAHFADHGKKLILFTQRADVLECRVVDARTGRETGRVSVTGLGNGPYTTAVSENGMILAAVTKTAFVIWDLARDKQVAHELFAAAPLGNALGGMVIAPPVRRCGEIAPAERASNTSLAVDKTGRHVVLCRAGMVMALFTNGKVRWAVETQGAAQATICADGRTIVCSDESGIYLYELATGKRRRTILKRPWPSSPRAAVAVTEDCRHVAYANYDALVMSRIDADEKSWTTKAPVGGGRVLAFSPAGSRLAYIGTGNEMHLMDSATGEVHQTIKIPNGHALTSIAYRPDGKALVVSGPSHIVPTGATWYFNERGESLIPDELHPVPPALLVFSPDGKQLASGCACDAGIEGHRLCLWDVATGKPIHRADNFAHGVNFLAYSADGKRLLAHQTPGGKNRSRSTFHVLNCATGREESVFRCGSTQPVSAQPGDLCACWEPGDRHITTFDWTGRPVAKMDVPGRTARVAVAADGSLAALVLGEDPKQPAEIHVRKFGDERSLLEIKDLYHPHYVTFGPDNKTLLLSGGTGVRVYDLSTGKVLLEHRQAAATVDFSPDGRYIALGEQGIRLIEVATGKVLKEWLGDGAFCYSLAFSPDGRRLASASLERTILIWDVEQK